MDSRQKPNLKLESLLAATKDIADANSAIKLHGDGKTALGKSINAYGNLLAFAYDFYSNIDKYSDERLIHILNILLIRRLVEVITFAISASSYKVPDRRDVFIMRLINNAGMSDKIQALMDRINTLSDDSKLAGSNIKGSTLPKGFPPGQLPQALNLLDTSKLAGYSSIIGLDSQVESIESIVGKSLESKSSISFILYGPPGTGKTSLAMAIGAEHGIPVLSISAAGLGGMYVGERESNLNRIFDYVTKLTTDIILFVDEADSFMKIESSSDGVGITMVRKTIKDYVFKIMAGRDVTKNKSIILILATNYYERIMVPVRELATAIFIPLPDENALIKIAEYYRRLFKLNFTEEGLLTLARESFRRSFSPSHVNLLFRRLASALVYKVLTQPIGVLNADTLNRPSLLVPSFTLAGETSTNNSRILVLNPPETVAGFDSSMETISTDMLPLYDEHIDFDSIKGVDDNSRRPGPVTANGDDTFVQDENVNMIDMFRDSSPFSFGGTESTDNEFDPADIYNTELISPFNRLVYNNN